MKRLIQTPAPGDRIVEYKGDVIEFTLTVPAAKTNSGKAWLRSNFGKISITRDEIISQVERLTPRQFRDWHDLPMERVDESTFRVLVPLLEVGRFEAKAFYLPANSDDMVWPHGGNTEVKVEPVDYCSTNIIYNAFVRQFGPTKTGEFHFESYGTRLEDLERDGITAIPPSGTFRELERQLDFIVDKLGCRIIQLLPIHPTPTVYGRMGRFGSPFASLDFLDVDPALAEFDRKTTPLQQFEELVDSIHSRHAKIFLDIAINHTGWASKLQVEHPEWFVRDHDESFYSPRAWGVIWEDLSKLDYHHRELWTYIADVFITWCRRGVDGFRCDAGYKIPWDVWEYLIAKVRHEFPDTIFLLEGLGGEVSTTVELLTKANLNWAYSELFQNYDRSEIEHYLAPALQISARDGILVNFAETHDNNRLASISNTYARLRTALAALTSVNGTWGFANGVEWYATEKIVVHEAPSLNWGNPKNQIEFISLLSQIVSTNPAFQAGAVTKMVQQGPGNSVAFFRRSPSTNTKVLVLINLDHDKVNPIHWHAGDVDMHVEELVDLLSGNTIKPDIKNGLHSLELHPGDVFCLTEPESPIAIDLPITLPGPTKHHQNIFQGLKACALDVFYAYHKVEEFHTVEPGHLAERLYKDPYEFCNIVNPKKGEHKIVSWHWPWDSNREVMIPPGFFLYFTAKDHFQLQMNKGSQVIYNRTSLPKYDGGYFVLIPPQPVPKNHTSCICKMIVSSKDNCVHETGHLLYLSDMNNVKAETVFSRSQILNRSLSTLCTNGRGAMAIANADWGKLHSRYDALLAGNLNLEYPEDKRIMLTRCRIWMIYYGFSREVNLDCLDQLFQLDDGSVLWRYTVPFCNGKMVPFDVRLEMIENENSIRLYFYRKNGTNVTSSSKTTDPVHLIIKPDIEDRNFHEDTKAFTGPEQDWPDAITTKSNGFCFSPASTRTLEVKISKGRFFIENEWRYMVHHVTEESRGLEPYSDLFSPGYFSVRLNEIDSVVLSANILTGLESTKGLSRKTSENKKITDRNTDLSSTRSLSTCLLKAMTHFIVKRQDYKTVIAGYPWFLDWGRDTLICTRGMIAAGMLDEVTAILTQFAKFEDQGTLPNVIYGDDVGNRDTSDAPLWFIIASADLVRAQASQTLLIRDCGGRSLLEVIKSIIHHYIIGTSNGIKMDGKSGLIYSPSHFTWMDTNFPAGTPRQGYPIEIQALWCAALRFASTIVESDEWSDLVNSVQHSIKSYFFRDDLGYFSDCLHSTDFQPPDVAEPDDHLRPNQLLAITLDAVKDYNLLTRSLSACQRLLVPGAIRSLDNRRVNYSLPIYREQQLLNDPQNPYWGRYEGEEDQRRKPAYHNGTAWTWMFPSFCEAWYKVYKETGRKTASAILGSATRLFNKGCIGQIPEILDGNYPHKLRGCSAQAWGVTELYRVISLLE